MSNIDYTLWPNANGTLGQIKVQIPDGINTTWPIGDVLVGNFVFNKGNLVGFVDTKALIANESKSTTFPYDYVNIQVDKSLEGVMTFNQGERTKYLTITYSGNSGDTIVLGTKYLGCKTLDDIKAIDSNYLTNNIIDGVWSEGLGDLENGENMFYYCSSLKSFTSDLSSLTNGISMFAICHNLTSFNSDLSNLTNGGNMFYNCWELTSFNSDLSNLTNGYCMFCNCKLDTPSVQNIADTINTISTGRIHISIGNSSPNTEEEAAFNKIASKGWTVYVNGQMSSNIWNPTSLTPIDGEEQQTPIPFWAKPVPSDEEHAQYTDQEGNFYNILGAQFIYGDNLETYGMFTSLEDAQAQMRLKKIGEEEIPTA